MVVFATHFMKREIVDKLADDQTKIWYAQENPKRPGSGSRDRYESYKHATTVGEALQMGSYKADLKHDFNRGFLHLEELDTRPSSQAPERQPPEDDPIEESPGESRNSSGKSAPRQDISQAFKKLKTKGHVKMAEVIADDMCHPSGSRPGRLAELRRPASPLQCDQLTVSDLCSRPSQDLEEILSQVEQNARDFAMESGLAHDEEVAPTEDDSSAEEPEPAPACLLESDWAEDDRRDEEFKEFQEDIAGETGLDTVSIEGDAKESGDGMVPISQSSQDADAAEEITLRCRFAIWKVKREVEEPDDSSAAKVPGASKGDLRHFFKQRSESRPGSDEDANDENNGENNEDGDEEKQAFESAQELSLEQNRSERRQRQERERDLLHQGSLEPLERLDEALVDAFTDACLLTWFESEENRKLLYDYLELQTKAVAWYKEPAQVYFEGRRRVMLSLLEQPDSDEAVTNFLEEEVATAQKALYYMPDKGHYLPSLFIHREDDLATGCVDLEE